MTVTIYHNPRCSKSRSTLAILQEKGIQPDVIEYLKTPPSKDQLKEILSLLGIAPRDLLRTGEEEYKTAGLADSGLSDDQVLDAMIKYPKLIERPIVVVNGKAVIGRPPESVESIL